MTRLHVVIVGGGAIGIVSALEILRDGHAVTIVEPGEPGGEQAASYGNAGWLSSHSIIPPAEPGAWKKVPGYLLDPSGPLAIRWRFLPHLAPWLLRYLLANATPKRLEATARALRPLLVGAPALHRGLAEEAGVAHLIEQAGATHVFPSRADFEAGRLGWDIRRALGVEWLELSEDEVRQREPGLDRRYTFGLHVGEAGRCRDPGAYVAALAALAARRGAVFVADKAEGFAIEHGRLVGVRTRAHGAIACDRAVICAGAWSKPLAARAGDNVMLETERGYHVVIKDPPVALRGAVMAQDMKFIATMTQGGLRAAGQVEFASLEAAPDWRRAAILRDALYAMLPGLPRDLPAERVAMWMGRRPSTPDGLPVIGRARASADIVHAFGHGHVGLVSSARTGQIVAQLVDGRAPEIPIAPFAAARFAGIARAFKGRKAPGGRLSRSSPER